MSNALIKSKEHKIRFNDRSLKDYFISSESLLTSCVIKLQMPTFMKIYYFCKGILHFSFLELNNN